MTENTSEVLTYRCSICHQKFSRAVLRLSRAGQRRMRFTSVWITWDRPCDCFCSCWQTGLAWTYSGTPTKHFITFEHPHLPLEANLSCTLCSLPGAWQLVISISGLQQEGNDLLFWDNVKYNVPLHSWKASCPDSLIAVGNSRLQTYEHLPNRDVHQLRGDAGLQQRWEGSPPETWGKTSTSHTAVSWKLTSTHSNATREIFFSKHLWKKTPLSACEALQRERWKQNNEGELLRSSHWKEPRSSSCISKASLLSRLFILLKSVHQSTGLRLQQTSQLEPQLVGSHPDSSREGLAAQTNVTRTCVDAEDVAAHYDPPWRFTAVETVRKCVHFIASLAKNSWISLATAQINTSIY